VRRSLNHAERDVVNASRHDDDEPSRLHDTALMSRPERRCYAENDAETSCSSRVELSAATMTRLNGAGRTSDEIMKNTGRSVQ